MSFHEFFSNLAGRFGQHIDDSIPDYAANRARVAQAFATLYTDVLDVGASEGQFGNLIGYATDGATRVHNVDPNRDMRNAWTPAPGNSYTVAAWVEGFDDIERFDTDERFDAVHMSMVRQFVTADARPWYSEAKRFLKPGGVFVTNVKLAPTPGQEDEWHRLEALKDDYKRQSFTQDEIDHKRDNTLTGMHTLMLSREEELAALAESFAYVSEYWTSYNFAGFVASNDIHALERFLEAVR